MKEDLPDAANKGGSIMEGIRNLRKKEKDLMDPKKWTPKKWGAPIAPRSPKKPERYECRP